jgi:DNA-binding Lrp family transcriptional regulator
LPSAYGGRSIVDVRKTEPSRAFRRASVEVLVHIRLAAGTPPTAFEEYLRGEPGVLHAWQTAGDIDFEVHLACGGVDDLHALLTRARREGGARETTTHLILKPAGPGPASAAEHHTAEHHRTEHHRTEHLRKVRP